MFRRRMTRSFLFVSSFLVLSLFVQPLIANAASLLQLSSDPFTNSSSQHKTEVEPDTFSFGSTIVSAFQTGRIFGGGSADIGWATSNDNGATWSNGFLPGTTVFATPPGPFSAISDPSVAYDAAHHTWLILSLAITSNQTVVVSRSTDNGHTWSNPISVAAGSLDKTWIVCDDTATSPFYGHCYTEWDNTSAGNLLQMSTSTNGGQTWSSPKAPSGGFHGLGGQPLVRPNGTVVVPYESTDSSSIRSFTSTNGGASWNRPVVISSATDHGVSGLRTEALPSAEIDSAGKVYVVWQDCRFEPGCTANDIVMSTSTNGTRWSAVTRIPLDPVGSGIDHVIPGLGVDRTTSGSSAHLALAYYYCSSTCQLQVGFVSSTNGGSTWSAKTTLTNTPMPLTWFANTNQGRMVGDYISTSISSNGRAFPVFAVATAPSGSTFNESMFTAASGLAVVRGAIRVGADRVLSATSTPARSH
ncbi:MAG: exo-alpha-sialidase, partial [Ktedonobacteraceae bacterium]|nr:exo-alpha-sialidase [Ktedonobacteraceae bacterium]